MNISKKKRKNSNLGFWSKIFIFLLSLKLGELGIADEGVLSIKEEPKISQCDSNE